MRFADSSSIHSTRLTEPKCSLASALTSSVDRLSRPRICILPGAMLSVAVVSSDASASWATAELCDPVCQFSCDKRRCGGRDRRPLPLPTHRCRNIVARSVFRSRIFHVHIPVHLLDGTIAGKRWRRMKSRSRRRKQRPRTGGRFARSKQETRANAVILGEDGGVRFDSGIQRVTRASSRCNLERRGARFTR